MLKYNYLFSRLFRKSNFKITKNPQFNADLNEKTELFVSILYECLECIEWVERVE